MAELPHQPMFWTDYFGDTTHLTTQEHGAYLLLMGSYWLKGSALPDDNQRLSRLARLPLKEWKRMRETIAEFFIVMDGVWQHKRIELDLVKVRHKVEQARSAGRISAQRRSNNRATDAQRSLNGRSNGRSTEGATKRQPSKSKASIYPLTPFERGASDAPGPESGRASTASEAQPIGSILKTRNQPKDEAQ